MASGVNGKPERLGQLLHGREIERDRNMAFAFVGSLLSTAGSSSSKGD
jgi:hypothetical protein